MAGYWPTGFSCECGVWNCGCIERGYICAPRGDDSTVIVSVRDSDGDEFDIVGATEIVFIVADGEIIGGNTYPGGTVLIEKRLSNSEIVIAGTGWQYLVELSAAETADLPRTNLYYETQVTTSAGLKKTVGAGIFKAENTMIKDIV